MKATELRIGNFVNYRIEDKFDERKEWLEQTVIDAVDLQLIDDDYSPIPLTGEWLLEFGSLGRYNCKYHKPCEEWFLMIGNHIDVCDVGFLYVHQLQNLYFALTGEELEIKNHKS